METDTDFCVLFDSLVDYFVHTSVDVTELYYADNIAQHMTQEQYCLFSELTVTEQEEFVSDLTIAVLQSYSDPSAASFSRIYDI